MPAVPELSIVLVRMEEACNFIDVAHRHGSMKHVSKSVQRCIGKAVGRVQRCKTESLDRALNASRPEGVQTIRSESSIGFIPETKVQIDRKRDLGIEIVAAPPPIIFAHHS